MLFITFYDAICKIKLRNINNLIKFGIPLTILNLVFFTTNNFHQ